MNSFSATQPPGGADFQPAWEGNERASLRGWRDDRKAVLAVVSGSGTDGLGKPDRLQREYELRDELSSEWAVRPLELREARRAT